MYWKCGVIGWFGVHGVLGLGMKQGSIQITDILQVLLQMINTIS